MTLYVFFALLTRGKIYKSLPPLYIEFYVIVNGLLKLSFSNKRNIFANHEVKKYNRIKSGAVWL